MELISWQKVWPKIVPISTYTPQCCVCVKTRAFFGNQINYNIEWGGKGGDKHCKLRFLPTFISLIVVIENTGSFFFNYYFILFGQHNFHFFKKHFICKKWFNNWFRKVLISLDAGFCQIAEIYLNRFSTKRYTFIPLFFVYCLTYFSGIPIVFILSFASSVYFFPLFFSHNRSLITP